MWTIFYISWFGNASYPRCLVRFLSIIIAVKWLGEDSIIKVQRVAEFRDFPLWFSHNKMQEEDQKWRFFHPRPALSLPGKALQVCDLCLTGSWRFCSGQRSLSGASGSLKDWVQTFLDGKQHDHIQKGDCCCLVLMVSHSSTKTAVDVGHWKEMGLRSNEQKQ